MRVLENFVFLLIVPSYAFKWSLFLTFCLKVKEQGMVVSLHSA